MERTLSSELFSEEKSVNNQAALPLRVLANLMLWQRRISSRHQLARLDSRLLADAGISEAQRYEELRGGPFMPTQAKQQNQSISGFEPYVETAGEEYMGKPMREHFTKILNKWKQDLMQEVDRTVDHMKDEAANFPDPADRASQEEEFSLELRARDRERKLIKKIDKTLQLIEDEEYGWCESCGVEIGIRRLEARPTADMCVDCKTLAEIKEKQVGK
jgi:DnaK suppressor protein